MSVPSSRREFIIKLASVSGALAAGSVLSACGGGDGVMVQFNYGVASGDPLSDRVILWTHAKYDGFPDAVPLTYQVATEASFTNVVSSGSVTAGENSGYTAKADAVGLAAGSEYYFRFRSGKWISPVGVTRTLPAAGATEVKLAVFSCSNYAFGYFNVYDAAAASDAQFAIHLGDYIYEYKDGEYPAAPVTGRNHTPTSELYSLEHYRTRHAQYKSDVNLKRLHARMPMIAVWDDHEIANDAYMTGAENHTEGAEGTFAARKANAIQAYHEWLPIRTGVDTSIIYRSFDFGNLLSLHMLDTRLIGREKQQTVAQLADPAQLKIWQSPKRQLMGGTQMTWLQNAMATSTAKWQVLGQQVVMAATWLPYSVQASFQAYFASPNATTVGAIITEVANYKTAYATDGAATYINAVTNPALPYNLDAWDGYLAARETLLQTFVGVAALTPTIGKKLVVLAGDTHNAWHNNLTLLTGPGKGTKVGEEFATASVSAPGWEAYFPTLTSTIKGLFEETTAISNVQWMDPSRRGYLKMTFTAAQAKGEWIFVDSVTNSGYTLATPAVTEVRTYAA
jgi:alkaline phosphatase D